jgi:hypothetical protein
MTLIKHFWKPLAASLAVLAATPALALDITNASFEYATGTRTKMIRFGVQSDDQHKFFASNGNHVAVYWDFTIAQWRANYWMSVPNARKNFWDIGATPVLRWKRDSGKGLYGEFAAGYHYLTSYYDNDGNKMSTRFEFGDHIGLGYVFDNGVDFSMKIQHFSNGGIKKPNTGANFVVAKIAMPF